MKQLLPRSDAILVGERADGAGLRLEALLGEVEALLRIEGGASEAIQVLTDGLREIKQQVGADEWTRTIIPAARAHAVGKLITQCPLTEHAQARPRGYPGDAGLLDIIYRHPAKAAVVESASALGRAIYDFTVAVPACEAVRQRRVLAAGMIDAVAMANPGADILSVACGNLREAELSSALQSGRIGSCVGVDQDPMSLEAARSYSGAANKRIVARQMSVRELLAGRTALQPFDLIYSMGLYDYLQAPSAARLTLRLFDLLKPKGRLLVANFLPDAWEAPYMEAYMDWHLNYRGESAIRAFASTRRAGAR